MSDSDSPKNSILGFVRELSTQSPLQDVAVDVLDLGGRVLASAISDANGYFAATLSDRMARDLVDVRRGSLVLVRATGSNALRGVASVFLTRDKLENPPAVVLEAGSSPTTSLQTYWVGGVVLDAEGAPVVGYRADVYDEGVTSDTLLTPDPPLTDSNGVFIAEYQVSGGDGLPNRPKVALRVDIVNTSTSALYGSSVARCAPGRYEVVAITSGTEGVSDETFRGPPEFALVAGAVDAAYGGVLASLTATQIDKIACRSGVSAAKVAAISWAATMAENTSVSTEAYYAIGRSGLPLSASSLYALDQTTIEGALTSAIDRGIVAESLAPSVSTIAVAIVGARGAAAMDDPTNPSQPTVVRELIETASLNTATVAQLVQDYYESGDTAANFWQTQRTTLGDATVDRVQFSLQAGTVSANHVPLVEHLQTLWGTSILESRDLAKFTQAQWENFLTETVGGSPVGVPSEFPGTSTQYAEAVHRMLEATMPTPAVAYRLQSSAITEDIAGLVEANPTFDFRTTDIEEFWSSATAPPGGLNATLKAQAKYVQRMFRVAPKVGRVQAVQAFLDDGATSALDLYAKGRPAFLKKFAASLGSVEAADATFERIEQRTLGVVNTFASLGPEIGQRVLASVVIPSPGCGTVDLEAIFGSLDACACNHCESITSPSAYLVDLLRWVSEQPDVNSLGRTMLEELLSRRPDIEQVDLNCDNSDTPVPTIDLVVEELEREVYRRVHSAGLPLDPIDTLYPSFTWPQTTLSPEVLRAVPENSLSEVYADLSQGSVAYPWSLTFSEPLTRARVYLEHLGLERARLLELFESFPLVSEGFTSTQLGTARNNEWIGVNQSTESLVTGPLDPGTETWDKLWGVSGTIAATIQNVDVFLDRSKLSFEELLDVLALRVADGIEVQYGPNCGLSESTISGLDETAARKLQAFLRLRPHTGWSLGELDGAISAVSTGLLDPDAGANPAHNRAILDSLANVKRLQDRFPSLPLEEVLAWLGDIDTSPWSRSGRSFYARRMRPENASSDLAVDTSTGELEGASGSATISDVKEDLMGFAGLKGEEFDAILAQVPSLAASSQISGANVTMIFRVASIANALRTSVEDLLLVAELLGTSDTAFGGSFEDLVELLDVAEQAIDSPLSIQEISYVLTNDGASIAAPTQKDLAVHLTDAITRLQLVEAEESAKRPASDLTPVARAIATMTRLGKTEDEIALGVSLVDATLPDSDPAPTTQELDDALDAAFSFTDSFVGGAPTLLLSQASIDTLKAKTADRADGATEAAVEDFVVQASAKLLDAALRIEVVRWLASAAGLLPEDAYSMLAVTLDENSMEPALLHFSSSDFWQKSTYDPDSDAAILADEGEIATFLALDDVKWRVVALRKLLKASRVAVAYGLRTDVLDWYFGPANEAPLAGTTLNLRNLPVLGSAAGEQSIEQWRWLDRAVGLHSRFVEPTALYGFVSFLVSSPAPNAAQVATAFASSASLDESFVLAVLSDANLLDQPLQLVDLRAVARTFDVQRALARLSVDAAKARQWGQGLELDGSSNTVEVAPATASEILAAAKSRNPPDVWPSVLEPAENKLRVQRRDLLLDWLYANASEWSDAEDVLRDKLVDVLVSPCGSSSRTLQAISMVQLFIFRVLMGLEGDFRLDRTASDEWPWLGRYRLWEANRKIFLYPENFLRPELRQDKTPLFSAFEEQVSRIEIDEDKVEDAYLTYLSGLNEVARPEIIGTCTQVRKGSGAVAAETIVHVLARSRKPGGKVFYRTQRNAAAWSAWEELPFDVGSPEVTMFVHRGRLVAVWLDVQENGEQKTETAPPEAHIEVGLMSAEYRNGAWSGPSVAKNRISIFDEVRLADRKASQAFGERKFSRILVTVDSRAGSFPKIAISYPVVSETDDPVLGLAGYFEYRACDEQFVAVPVAEPPFELAPGSDLAQLLSGFGAVYGRTNLWSRNSQPPKLDLEYGAFATYGENEKFQIRVDHPVLKTGVNSSAVLTAAEFSIVGERNNGVPLARHPFFFQDRERTFFLAPREGASALGKDTELEGLATQTLETDGASVPGKAQELHFFPLKYRLTLHYHPFVCEMMEQVSLLGAKGLARPPQDVEASNSGLACQQLSRDVFGSNYEPGLALLKPLPREEFDFSPTGAYSIYNWELFVYVPMLVADRYMQQGRFAEAREWLHAIFDPTRALGGVGGGRSGPGCTNYWWAKPLKDVASQTHVQDMLDALQQTGADYTHEANREKIEAQISQWRSRPFDPHVIARMRPQAFQMAVVIKYIDLLIAWGDSLFRQDTVEANNEATQLYMLAKQILGRRPVRVEKEDDGVAKRFSEIKGSLNAFGNVAYAFEDSTTAPGDQPAVLEESVEADDGYVQPPGHQPPFTQLHVDDGAGGMESYFCIPPNDAMLSMWDTVDDRLFKLRNCLNIEGVFRQLPLFQPPIDPALVAAALAQGVDLGSAIAGLNAPVPYYRFGQMLGVAKDLTSEVVRLGGELLSALEKRDSEEISQLRSHYERTIADATIVVRKEQIDAAQEVTVHGGC